MILPHSHHAIQNLEQRGSPAPVTMLAGAGTQPLCVKEANCIHGIGDSGVSCHVKCNLRM